MDGKAGVTEHSQRHSRRVLWRCSVTLYVKHGKVARADNLHGTIVGCSSHNEGRKLSGKSALAENTVGVFDHAVELQTGFCEAAKRGMKVAHEHRRGNALAGNIPQHKEQATLCFEEIAVITAYHACRLIVITDVPPNWCQARFRQEPALDALSHGKRSEERRVGKEGRAEGWEE